MKKYLFLSFVLFTIIGVANAQNTNIKYQGDVHLGYSFGIGTFATDRINLHMVNGVRINEYFSTGVGLGLDCFTDVDDYVELAMPIFVNAKGYLPVSQNTNLVISMDLGGSFGLTEGLSGMSGLMMTPAVGANFKIANSKAINISFGYNYHTISEGGLSVNVDALTFRVGFSF